MREKAERVKKLSKILDRIEDYVEASLIISITFLSLVVAGFMVFQFFSKFAGGDLRTVSAVISLLGTFLVLTLVFSLASGPIRRLEGKRVLPWIIVAGTMGLIGNLLTAKFNPLDSPVEGGKSYAVFLVMFLVMLFAYVIVDEKQDEVLKDIV